MAGQTASPMPIHMPSHSTPKEQKAWGIAGDVKDAARTITLDMSDDMRFKPSQFEVKRSETVRLRVVNKGQVMHEVVLGTKSSLDEHAQMMLKHPGMEHDEPYMAHVAPGKSEDLVWNFNRPGSFEFACLIAGHYQAGMTGRFIVTE
jgi:uncharacterized cupredoxin-like copper-binding protein